MNASSPLTVESPATDRIAPYQAGDEPHPADGSASVRNVAEDERLVSMGTGAVLAGMGLARRDLTGLLIAGLGGALIYRGTTGHCHVYDMLGVDTAERQRGDGLIDHGVRVTETFLIDKPREELYRRWRNLEELPRFMSHLKSVEVLDDKRSVWTAKAPAIGGSEVSWEAEITSQQPNERIAWQTVPDSQVDHRGMITFSDALGDRGTRVRIELDYAPPAGKIGRWLAKLFGEEPQQQIRSDLRKFKQLMETGEIPTVEGQSHGSCHGIASMLHK